MQIDKYIEELTKLRQAHGPELEVMRTTNSVDGAVGATKAVKAALPRIAHMQVGHVRTLFRDGRDPNRLKGQKVVAL